MPTSMLTYLPELAPAIFDQEALYQPGVTCEHVAKQPPNRLLDNLEGSRSDFSMSLLQLAEPKCM